MHGPKPGKRKCAVLPFTSAPITQALADAHKRGVTIQVPTYDAVASLPNSTCKGWELEKSEAISSRSVMEVKRRIRFGSVACCPPVIVCCI
ncbi:hypothetical protein Cflav_PD5128 [Pedosphaera parvula Ellin514]|uniref:Uncharacterized protein n=1 Tax=Pedosphaera parvula (strain Ellin514) TaxID=320771 RepID=B9XC25_PEDPL|nr:hypothetical protein Cflav_PD5128 [Pedosphaera parvula Ellin514]